MISPMTDEQRKLAEEHHDLVYAFLKENNLPESQYYDIVIFGYLCTVQEYCENPALQRYHFATVAWKKMHRELVRYYKYLSSDKRSMSTVSFDEPISEGSNKRWSDVLYTDDGDLLDRLQSELILHDLAAKLPKREMRIIRMKLKGEKMHDIAKSEHITFHDINRLLEGAYATVISIILG